MQVGSDHRHAGQVVGVDEGVVVRGVRFVDAGDDRLQWGVARLDQVAVSPVGDVVVVGWQPVGQRHHERVSAGAQTQRQRADVEQHPVADDRGADERQVGQSGHLARVGRRAAPVRRTTVSSTAPRQTRPTVSTWPDRHRISVTPADATGRFTRTHVRVVLTSWRVPRRTERLVNLVICLLATRRFLTAAQIAETVPGYEHDRDDPRAHEAFQRKLERDKAELRALGVPLETGTDSVFDTEPGYRIARREYALPDISLEPDEAAVVGIAARLWQHAGLAAAASSGLAKLRAAGIEVDPQATLGVEPVVTADAAFGPLVTAARERSEVTFDYRVPERDAPTPAICNRGGWCAGVDGGMWSATTWTGRHPAASGCRGSSAR